MAAVLRNLRITRVAIVDKGANFDPATGDGAHILLYKRDLRKSGGPGLADVHVPTTDDEDQRDEYEKATLTSGQRNALPDSSFAAVWTDGKGKKQRKLPYKHPDGSIDATHLGPALGRIDQTPMPPDVKSTARGKLQAASAKQKEKRVTKQNTFLKRLTAAIVKAFPPAAKPAAGGEGDGQKPPFDVAKATQDLQDMQAHHAALGKVIDQQAATAPGGDASKLPADHPVHQLKALHASMGKSIDDQQQKIAAAAACDPMDGDDEDPLDGIADNGDGEGDDVNAAAPEMAKRIAKRLETRFEKRYADLKKIADDATARTVAVEKAAAAERDARDTDAVRATITKFARVGANLETDTAVLLAIKKADPKAYDRMVAIMAGADEQLRQSALYKSFGGGGGEEDGSADAWAKIEALAEKLVEKGAGGKPLTKQAAIAKVCNDPKNKALVNQYYRTQQ